MERFCCVKLLLIAFCASAVVFSTFAAKTEECGVITADQYSNMQKFAQIDEFPWMAKIAYRNGTVFHNNFHSFATSISHLKYLAKTSKTSFACHAVLISSQHLLTAAHCLNEKLVKPYAVLFGDWNSSNNITTADCDEASGKCFTPILIDIEKFVRHPVAESDSKNNDIGLLRLTEKVTFSDYIRPICLPSNDSIAREFESKQLTVSGWLMKKSGEKQKLAVSIYNQQDCSKSYEKLSKITDSQICAKSCQDGFSFLSAAALMDVVDQESRANNVYLAGLLSFGSTDCAGDLPDIFTRTDKYLDWIEENMH